MAQWVLEGQWAFPAGDSQIGKGIELVGGGALICLCPSGLMCGLRLDPALWAPQPFIPRSCVSSTPRPSLWMGSIFSQATCSCNYPT